MASTITAQEFSNRFSPFPGRLSFDAWMDLNSLAWSRIASRHSQGRTGRTEPVGYGQREFNQEVAQSAGFLSGMGFVVPVSQGLRPVEDWLGVISLVDLPRLRPCGVLWHLADTSLADLDVR